MARYDVLLLVATLMLALGGAPGAEAFWWSRTAWDVLSRGSDTSTLAALMRDNMPDLVTELKKSSAQVTIFAPTNAAISAGVAAVAALLNVPTSAIVSNRALVSSVIRYHVVPSSKLSSRGLHPFQQASTALAGAQLTITKSGSTVRVSGSSDDNTAKVVRADVSGSKGVIHIIDKLLLPPPPSVASLLDQSPQLSTLKTLIADAGLQGLVNDTALVATLFAPTNNAFGRLLQQLNATLEDVRSNKTLLTQVLGLHAVPGAAVLSYQLQPRQTVNTLAGLPLTVWSWGPKQVVVQGRAAINVASVVAANARAGKAVVHVIDAVLLPFCG